MMMDDDNICLGRQANAGKTFNGAVELLKLDIYQRIYAIRTHI